MARVGGASTSTPSDDNIEIPEGQLRATAQSLGLDFDAMGAEDIEFLASYEAAAAVNAPGAPAAPSDDTPNPLIPTDDNPLTPDALQDAGASSPAEPGSGPGSSGDGPPDGADNAPAAGTVPPTPAPGETTPPSPSPIPIPPSPPVPGGSDDDSDPLAGLTEQQRLVLDGIENGWLRYEFTDPRTGQPVVMQGTTPVSPLPGETPAPGLPGQLPPGLTEEWDDPRAQQAYAQLYAMMQQTATNQAQAMQAQIEAQQRALEAAIDRGVETFAEAYHLTEEQMDELTNLPQLPGLLRGYAELYPGDPSSAAQAALGAAYWTTPEYRDAAISAYVEMQIQERREVERKKAAAGGITSGSGSPTQQAPALPPPGRQRDQAMADFIEKAISAESGNGQG